MAFSGVLEEKHVFRNQKFACGAICPAVYKIFPKKAPQARKSRVFGRFFYDFRGPRSDKKCRIFKNTVLNRDVNETKDIIT